MGAKRVKIHKKSDQTGNKDESLLKNESIQEDLIQPGDSVTELETQLKAAQEEIEETRDRLLRVSAEFDNYKKRSAREIADFRKFANESLIKEVLPVVDNLERALDSTSQDQFESQSVIEGVQMTLAGILKIFDKFQVKPIESLGKTFDPGFHQAVMVEETDIHPDKTVLKELHKGYLMHDKLIRPAMVVVSKNKTATLNQENSEPGNTEADHNTDNE